MFCWLSEHTVVSCCKHPGGRDHMLFLLVTPLIRVSDTWQILNICGINEWFKINLYLVFQYSQKYISCSKINIFPCTGLSMVNRIMSPPPKMSESLKPVNITLHGKDNFAYVIKVSILRRGDYPGLYSSTQCNHKGLRQEGRSEREREMWWQKQRSEWPLIRGSQSKEGGIP